MLETPKDPRTDKVTLEDIATMDNQQETGIAWLAGILDGEGYVSICKNWHKTGRGNPKDQFTPRITIGSTSEEIIEKVVRVLQSINVGHLVKDRKLKSGKTFKTVVVVGALRVMALLPKVIPHLTLKLANAKRIVEFVESRLSKPRCVTYSQYELSLIQACKTGPSETTREAPVEETDYVSLLDDDIVHAAAKVGREREESTLTLTQLQLLTVKLAHIT